MFVYDDNFRINSLNKRKCLKTVSQTHENPTTMSEIELKKKKLTRSTNAQIRMLIDFMAANPKFANGEMNLDVEKQDQIWAELQKQLSEEGPDKSIGQWKHTWRDLKKKAREMGRLEAKARTKSEMPIISINSTRILEIIGREVASGETEGADINDSSRLTFPNSAQADSSEFEEIQIEVNPSLSLNTPSRPYPLLRLSPLHRGPSPQNPLASPQVSPVHACEHKYSIDLQTQQNDGGGLHEKEFIQLQRENNNILQSISTQLERSNQLRCEQNNIMRELVEILKRDRSAS